MNWLDSSNWANIAKTAKTAVKYAQKNIDKVLEIPEIITEKDPVAGPPAAKKNEANGSTLAEVKADVKEETEGFFSLFGVLNPSSSNTLSHSTSRLKVSPSVSRVSSSTSLSGLRAVEAWDSSEVHSSNHSEPVALARKSESSLHAPEFPVSFSAGGLRSSSSVSSFLSSSQERLKVISGSAERLDNLDSRSEFLSAQIPDGRLEILFHDDDSQDTASNPESTNDLVEISLNPSPDIPVIASAEKNLENGLDLTADFSGSESQSTIGPNVLLDKEETDKVNSVVVSRTDDEPSWTDDRLTDVRIVRVSSSEEEREEATANENSRAVNQMPFVKPTETSLSDSTVITPVLPESSEEPVALNIGTIQKELELLRSVLSSREQKLLDISRENAQLKEINDNLSSQVSDLQTSESDLEQLQRDYTSTERKLQQIQDDKVSLTEQLQLTKSELSNSTRVKPDVTAAQLKEVLKKVEEKDEQIKGLMEEGEKLSKQQFQSSSHIKKLKAKQNDLEGENAKLKSDLDDRTAEVATLKSTLNLAEEFDQKNNATIKQLNATVDRLEKEILTSRNLHDESKSKISSMQGALDSVYKELSELHRQKATQEGHVHETLLTTELAAKEELRLALEQQKQDLIRGQEELIERVETLQISLNRAEATVKRKEEAHREEVADFQARLQDSMTRNEEISQNLTHATRPLLRQNETLQRQIAEQTATFDKLERNLTKRIQEASMQLTLAQEKDRDATEKLAVLTGKFSALESQVATVRDERSDLAAELDVERRRVREQEEKVVVFRAELEKLRDSTSAEINSLRREKQVMEHQIALERENLAMEQRKTMTLTEQVADLQARANIVKSDSAISLKRSDSVNSTTSTLDGRWSPGSQSTSNSSLYDVLRGGSAPFLDSVQSQLRLKEGEIQFLKTELRQLEASRQRNTEEMIKLNDKTQELETMKSQMADVQAAKEELERRYHAMLQMYGEKAEELQELRLDYEDMKALYKSQIDALTQKS